jgi:branched-chain amino acid transport system permease protein
VLGRLGDPVAINLMIFITSTLVLYGVYLILAISLNLEYGFAGQPNFGKVFFFSVGAYATGVLVATLVSSLANFNGDIYSFAASTFRSTYAMTHPLQTIGVFILALLVSIVVGAIFGYLASYPALRLREDYLSITLLLLGEISRSFVRSTPSIAGGANGLGGIPNPFAWLNDGTAILAAYAILVMAIAGLVYWYANRLANAPYGRMLKSMRDDENASKSLGKVVPRMKGEILLVGSAMAGLAGCLYTFYLNYVSADSFITIWTINAWLMVIVGGVANNKGAVVGALLLTALQTSTQFGIIALGISATAEVDYLRYIAISALLIVVLVFRPKGLIPEKPQKTTIASAVPKE